MLLPGHLDQGFPGEVGGQQLRDLDALVFVRKGEHIGEVGGAEHPGARQELAHLSFAQQGEERSQRGRLDHAGRSRENGTGTPRRISTRSTLTGEASSTSSSRPRTRNRSPLAGKRPASSTSLPPMVVACPGGSS